MPISFILMFIIAWKTVWLPSDVTNQAGAQYGKVHDQINNLSFLNTFRSGFVVISFLSQQVSPSDIFFTVALSAYFRFIHVANWIVPDRTRLRKCICSFTPCKSVHFDTCLLKEEPMKDDLKDVYTAFLVLLAF